MSLINDVLRNIEAKRPDDPVRQNLQREIRSLPAGKRGYGGAVKLLLGLGGVLALGAAGYYASSRLDEARPVALPPPPAPVLVQPPPIPTPEPVPVVPAVAPVDDNLRLSAQLAAVPLPVAPVLGVPDPVAPQPAAVRSDAATAAASPPAVPAGPVKIEKSPLAPTVRDKADAEFRRAETALASGRSGEALEGHVGDPGYDHAELGEQLVWFVLPVLVLSAVLVWLARRPVDRRPGPAWLPTAVAVVAVIASVACAVQVYRVGDSGARAAWGDRVSSSSSGGDQDSD